MFADLSPSAEFCRFVGFLGVTSAESKISPSLDLFHFCSHLYEVPDLTVQQKSQTSVRFIADLGYFAARLSLQCKLASPFCRRRSRPSRCQRCSRLGKPSLRAWKVTSCHDQDLCESESLLPLSLCLFGRGPGALSVSGVLGFLAF